MWVGLIGAWGGILGAFIARQFAKCDFKMPSFNFRRKNMIGQQMPATIKNDRARIVAQCQKCAHRKFDPSQGLVCGLTDKPGNFQDECGYFHHENEYTAKRRAEANLRGFENKQMGVLTKWDIQSVLAEAKYTVREEREEFNDNREVYITHFAIAENVGFTLIFDGISLFINYDFTIKLDAEIGQAIAKNVMENLIVVKTYVQESPDEDGNIGIRFAIEALVHYSNEFRVQFARYVDILSEAARRFGRVMDEYNKMENKRRRSIYNKEYSVLPNLVDAITDGKCGNGALGDEEWLREYLRRGCDEECVPLWDEFRIVQIERYGEYVFFVYRFPLPEAVPEALYGAVLLDSTTNHADYYTLEYSYNDKWVLGSTSRGKHSNFGEINSPNLEQFVAWIFSSKKQLCYYTDINGRNTQQVN